MNRPVRALKDIEHLLPMIKGVLKKIYGRRLGEVILYGSFAKDKATADSDIDIAVVIKGKVRKTEEIKKICDVLYEMELESGELISINPLSRKELEDTEWPLYEHIKKEGIRV